MATSNDDMSSHAAGLGVMPSMSTECTPLKHRYDACFNKWFEDYLALPPPSAPFSLPSSSSDSPASSSSSSSSGSSSTSGLSGLFSRSSNDTVSSTATSSSSITIPGERKKLRDRLEGECGSFWKEYQSCVIRAVKEKDLDGLIEEARIQNPFPFPHERKHREGVPNNEPFPFPAASSDNTQ